MHPETTPETRPEKKHAKTRPEKKHYRYSLIDFLSFGNDFLSFGKFLGVDAISWARPEGKEGKLPIPEYGLEYGTV